MSTGQLSALESISQFGSMSQTGSVEAPATSQAGNSKGDLPKRVSYWLFSMTIYSHDLEDVGFIRTVSVLVCRIQINFDNRLEDCIVLHPGRRRSASMMIMAYEDDYLISLTHCIAEGSHAEVLCWYVQVPDHRNISPAQMDRKGFIAQHCYPNNCHYGGVHRFLILNVRCRSRQSAVLVGTL